MSYHFTREQTIAEFRPGLEVTVVIQDPINGQMIWMRGTIKDESAKLIDVNPRGNVPSFHERRPTLGMILVDPEYRLDLKLPLRTFTVGWPNGTQMMQPVPAEFQAEYFRQEADL